jgi:hypothetical protein
MAVHGNNKNGRREREIKCNPWLAKMTTAQSEYVTADEQY